MNFDIDALPEKFKSGLRELTCDYGFATDGGIKLTAQKGTAGVARTRDGYAIAYDKDCEFYREFVALLCGRENTGESCAFKNMGVMLDCSRNAVLKPSAVKRYIRLLACMGYDTLMLYTEDTYETDGEPYFGYLRGRYGKAELKDMDAYAAVFGVELVPCIQTLAHLNAITRWDRFKPIIDCNDILLAGDDRTYAFIDKMFKTLSECFTSRRVHIGMDEAHAVGLGKYLDEHGYTDRFTVLSEHLDRVLETAAGYGFTCTMWSDMFFRLANNGRYSADADGEKWREVSEIVPDNVTLMYWDYYADEQAHYEKMLDAHRKLGARVAFAGGAWRWNGFMPANTMSVNRTALAFAACRKFGIDEVLMTVWGDDGCECSAFSVLPALVFAAENAYGNAQYKAAFKAVVGVEYDDFNAIELADDVTAHKGKFYGSNISKALLYNDLLCGIYDCLVTPEYADRLAANARAIKAAAKRCGRYAGLLHTATALAELNAQKCDFGLRVRAAYKSGDKAQLQALADKIPALIGLLNKFYKAFSAQWDDENKPFGFEVQDARLGGLKQRMRHCRKILVDYVCGKTESIPQAEEQILQSYMLDENGDRRCERHWCELITVCPV